MVLTDTLKAILIETAITLKGAARRRFMAQTVKALGRGGYAQAERELDWNAGTVRNIAHRAHHPDQAQRAGLPSDQGGESQTQKKIPETDAIFDHIATVNRDADADPTTLRISMDAKATVNIGAVARGGKSRVPTKALDHDVQPDEKVTPVGILMPSTEELFVYGGTSKVTSDCLVDRLAPWWDAVRPRFAPITTLVINLDNGPENHSRRTQFMLRLVDFVQATGLTIQLASYPPYHRKYNTIERCWGVLEHHWNGSLLDSLQGTLDHSESLTWRGVHPIVTAVTRCYRTGVKLTKEAMAAVEQRLSRDPRLGKWFVTITPRSEAT